MTITAHRLEIRGRVQAVGYRDAAVQVAFECHVQGWVRNRREGHVEAFVQGESAAVERFVAWCHRGPPLARVADIARREAEVDPRLAAFETRATI
jgi:acylphosphatase